MIDPPYANARAFLRSSVVAPGNRCRSSFASDSSQTESMMLSWVRTEYEYNRGEQRNILISRTRTRKRCMLIQRSNAVTNTRFGGKFGSDGSIHHFLKNRQPTENGVLTRQTP